MGVTHFLLPRGPTQILPGKHLGQVALRRERGRSAEEEDEVSRVRRRSRSRGAGRWVNMVWGCVFLAGWEFGNGWATVCRWERRGVGRAAMAVGAVLFILSFFFLFTTRILKRWLYMVEASENGWTGQKVSFFFSVFSFFFA